MTITAPTIAVSRELSLLLVDDDDVDREATERRLQRSGLYHVSQEATTGAEALDCVERHCYDCVVLDYRLADTNAIDLLPELRKRSMQRDLAVVMLTGTGNARVAVQAIKLGVHDYLHKSNPDGALLRQAIEHAVLGADRQRLAREQTEQLEHLVLYDPLTGLANRFLFFERLEHAIGVADRTSTSFAVLAMDLDRFKEVNDSLGHAAGDRVLAAIGPLLSRKLRRTDTLARVGGDEFAAVLPSADGIAGALLAAEKLIAAVATPAPLGDAIVTVGLSVGIAMYPLHGTTVETLMANADQAMYVAKREGSGVAVYSSPGTLAPRADLISTRTAALTSGNELVLYYQPQIDLSTGALRSVEALVRWQHPELGLLLPMEFIPAAERSTAIRPISYAILDKALDQAVAWAAAGTPTPVAVNLSVRMLDDPDLPARVLDALALRSLAPQTLTLEVTETVAITRSERAVKLLGMLARGGVRISIDDFGAGYTSFRFMKEFPIAEIKIDQIFIDGMATNLGNVAIVRAIIELGRGFGVDVVAEGIESMAVRDQLVQLGCRYGQGFHIAIPSPAEEFERWRLGWREEVAGQSLMPSRH